MSRWKESVERTLSESVSPSIFPHLFVLLIKKSIFPHFTPVFIVHLRIAHSFIDNTVVLVYFRTFFRVFFKK